MGRALEDEFAEGGVLGSAEGGVVGSAEVDAGVAEQVHQGALVDVLRIRIQWG